MYIIIIPFAPLSYITFNIITYYYYILSIIIIIIYIRCYKLQMTDLIGYTLKKYYKKTYKNYSRQDGIDVK